MRKQVEESTAAESARRATRPAAERDRNRERHSADVLNVRHRIRIVIALTDPKILGSSPVVNTPYWASG